MLQPSDIKFFLSGGQINIDPLQSLGGDYSDTQVGTDINNLFEDISSTLSREGYVDYKCIYLFNKGASKYDWVFDSSVWTDIQKNIPIQIDLGFTLNDDVQQITVSGSITDGYIILEYTDIAAKVYNTSRIYWSGSMPDFATQIQNQLNYLEPIVGGITVSASVGSGFTNIIITFGEDDGNKVHNLLNIQNYLNGTGINIQISKISDGSPINTIADKIEASNVAPSGIFFQSTNNLNKKTIGTLQLDEGFPIWIRRTIRAGTTPSSNAGATIKFNGKIFPVDSTPKPTLEPTPTPSGATQTPSPTDPTPTPTPTPTATLAYGNLWVWGQNQFGQLGINSTQDNSEPIQLQSATNLWADIGKPFRSTFITQTDNTLWAWGANIIGCLSNSTTTAQSSPVQIQTDKTWSTTSNGIDFTLFLTTTGQLYTAGTNLYGQLGDGTTISKSSPVFLSGNLWKQIDAGSYFAAAISNDNRLWLWGNAGSGNIGNLSVLSQLSPVQTAFATTDWKLVSCGYNFVCAIKTNGTLWSWGLNNFGQLGINYFGGSVSSPMQVGFLNTWEQVSCGREHVMAVTTDKKLYVWGKNDSGQLGLGDTNKRNTPIQVSYAGQQIGSYVSQISAGGENSAYINTGNNLYVCGRNTYGQLGNKTNNNSNLFFDLSKNNSITTKWEYVRVGYNYMLAKEQ
jgi:alpha-tubulin suppressor-like RCC1 family protein